MNLPSMVESGQTHALREIISARKACFRECDVTVANIMIFVKQVLTIAGK